MSANPQPAHEDCSLEAIPAKSCTCITHLHEVDRRLEIHIDGPWRIERAIIREAEACGDIVASNFSLIYCSRSAPEVVSSSCERLGGTKRADRSISHFPLERTQKSTRNHRRKVIARSVRVCSERWGGVEYSDYRTRAVNARVDAQRNEREIRSSASPLKSRGE